MNKIAVKLILSAVLIAMVSFVVYANCSSGCTEQDAHSYINGEGKVVTHCPYNGGASICCTDCPTQF